ncbi:hypothetical protein D3C73_643100 [compost metagenome]
MAISSEMELYAPIKAFFELQGYQVRAEVKHCDVVAIRGDEQPIIIELKRSFNIPLIVQGIDRLRLSEQVYVAFELPNKGRAPYGLGWDDLRRLCRMLGLGMITVQFFKRKKPSVDIVCDPQPYTPRPNKRAARNVVTEFRERSGDYNVGGSSKQKLMTAYREKALQCVYHIKQNGPLAPKTLKELTGHGMVNSLLQKNYYLWFIRTSRGIYDITPAGEQALIDYAHVLLSYQQP